MTARGANAAERRYWSRVVACGCIVGPLGCAGRVTIHHCFTGGGGRKNHKLVLPLCWGHHLGPDGIDGKRLSKREWQEKHGAESYLMRLLEVRLMQEF